MKITVYAICKNEAAFAPRWLDSMAEADAVCLLDTGSEDDTVAVVNAWAAVHDTPVILKQERFESWRTVEEYDAIVRRGGRPWRFDTARNTSLALVPVDTDLCVCTDLDECFVPGWRAILEAAWTPEATTARYPYIWSFRPDGSDGVRFYGEKIHRRGVCRWVHPVHEVLAYDVPRLDVTVPTLRLEHHADPTKSRGGYLALLELAVREDPAGDRNAHYLGREYYFHGQYGQAVAQLKAHLALPSATWREERAASMRYIARSCAALGDEDLAELWYRRAIDEAPGQREAAVELAELWCRQENWPGVVRLCHRALAIRERPMTYMTDPAAWGERPWDLLSVARWYSGERTYAVNCCREALRLAPDDERIRNNLRLMEEKQEEERR